MSRQKRFPAALSVAKLTINTALKAWLEVCIDAASDCHRRNIVGEGG